MAMFSEKSGELPKASLARGRVLINGQRLPSDPPVRYIVGVRMRRQKEVNTSVLGSRSRQAPKGNDAAPAFSPRPAAIPRPPTTINNRNYLKSL